jgi:hypothetical protein
MAAAAHGCGCSLRSPTCPTHRGAIDDRGESDEEHVEELTATLGGRYGRLLLRASGVVPQAHRGAAAALLTWCDGLRLARTAG